MNESMHFMKQAEAHRFMTETLQYRIGRRVLAQQHIALSAIFNGGPQEEHCIGIVKTHCNAVRGSLME